MGRPTGVLRQERFPGLRVRARLFRYPGCNERPQVDRAGEKVFIDYLGKKSRIWSAETGEAIDVELFVAVLGASNYTFAEATRAQRLEDFCASKCAQGAWMWVLANNQ